MEQNIRALSVLKGVHGLERLNEVNGLGQAAEIRKTGTPHAVSGDTDGDRDGVWPDSSCVLYDSRSHIVKSFGAQRLVLPLLHDAEQNLLEITRRRRNALLSDFSVTHRPGEGHTQSSWAHQRFANQVWTNYRKGWWASATQENMKRFARV